MVLAIDTTITRDVKTTIFTFSLRVEAIRFNRDVLYALIPMLLELGEHWDDKLG